MLLRRRVTSGDFQVIHGGQVEIRINGADPLTVPSPQLGKFLNKQVDCEIRLDIYGNGRSAQLQSRYYLQITIPLEAELDAAETAFFTQLAKSDVGLREVEKFARDCEGLRSCNDYVSGLVDYVLGTLIKDRAGNVSLDFREFLEKYHSAIALLEAYDRSLARITCSFIRFNLNDFVGYAVPCGVDKLDAATAFFQTVAGFKVAQHSDSTGMTSGGKRICPLDQASETLIIAAAKLRHNDAEQPAMEVAALAERRMVSSQDRAKAHVLLAELHTRSGRSEEAAKAARYLSNDPLFGSWAQKIDTHKHT